MWGLWQPETPDIEIHRRNQRHWLVVHTSSDSNCKDHRFTTTVISMLRVPWDSLSQIQVKTTRLAQLAEREAFTNNSTEKATFRSRVRAPQWVISFCHGMSRMDCFDSITFFSSYSSIESSTNETVCSFEAQRRQLHTQDFSIHWRSVDLYSDVQVPCGLCMQFAWNCTERNSRSQRVCVGKHVWSCQDTYARFFNVQTCHWVIHRSKLWAQILNNLHRSKKAQLWAQARQIKGP